METTIYNETLGQLLDYKNLIDFISSNSSSMHNCTAFIDAPCGTGVLLKQADILKKKLAGIDLRKDRTQESWRLNKSITIVEGNILDINKISELKHLENAYLHMGFSFMNIFPKAIRREIITAIHSSEFIKSVGFEIQNYNYQIENYESNKWYINKLKNGTILKSRNTHIDSESYKLELCFKNGVQEVTETEKLFFWRLDDCIKDCLNFNWSTINIKPATYRNNSEISHWYIELTK